MMVRLPALLACLLALLVAVGTPAASAVQAPRRTPVPPATGTPVLAADAERRWIPFTLTAGNQIRFAMTLDGRAVSAILDTGVSDSVLARHSPAVDPARLGGTDRATTIGGSVPIAWMAVRSLVIGPLTKAGGRLAVAPLPASATGDAESVDVLVGRDLLAAQALDIDYPARRFRLLPSGRMPFAGAVAPLQVSPRLRVYQTALTIAGRRLSPMVLDTGDGASVTLTHADWLRAMPPGQPSTTAIAFGLAGPLVTDLAILPEVRLGTLVARDVEVRAEPDRGFSASIGAAGRIGSSLLGRYRVLLDPTAGRMVLAPGPGADRPPLRSTSGLLVALAPDRLRVVHVMRGSPAAADGWKDGDLICAIDGQPIARDYPTSALARWNAAPAGTVTRLTDCAGADRTLTARIFY